MLNDGLGLKGVYLSLAADQQRGLTALFFEAEEPEVVSSQATRSTGLEGRRGRRQHRGRRPALPAGFFHVALQYLPQD